MIAMLIRKYVFFIALASLLTISCISKKGKKLSEQEVISFRNQGDEITIRAQNTLLAHVSTAMQKGGPDYAVEFCNVEVSGIMDSLVSGKEYTISRISEKNRNANNAPKSTNDKEVLKSFLKKVQEGKIPADTLLMSKNHPVYYRPIMIGLEACLKCHGNPNTDIMPSTLAKIDSLYPNDLAKGYSMKELRGAWKINFTSSESK